MSAIEFRLGWTLLHFLWQGVSISAVYGCARIWTSRSSPNTRYILGCIALAFMIASPLVTFGLMHPPGAVAVSGHRTVHVVPAVSIAPSVATSTLPSSLRAAGLAERPRKFLTWIVMLWLAGATAFWVRLMGGWALAARMRTTQVRSAPPEWQQSLNSLSSRIGVSRPVRLLISALVQVPTVI